MKKIEIIKEYLIKYPNLPNLTIAKKIYNENKLLFNNIESVRSLIRYLKGSRGLKEMLKLKDDTFLSEEKLKIKYNLPKSIKQKKYEPYKIISNTSLIFSDVHIPFHDEKSLIIMFDYIKNNNIKIDSIIINGDLLDCFDISFFEKEPNLIRFKDEIKLTKNFLKELKNIFQNVKIYYKFGNHEHRFERYLAKKAPEIFDCEEFRLNILLDLYNLGIIYIEQEKYIILNNNLKILHGHEYKNAITSPANPARTIFLRTKSNALVSHYHQTSQHVESRINNDILSCWSIGCLCNLNPKYMPLNKWNLGFAIYNKDKNMWFVENKMIIKNKVV